MKTCFSNIGNHESTKCAKVIWSGEKKSKESQGGTQSRSLSSPPLSTWNLQFRGPQLMLSGLAKVKA